MKVLLTGATGFVGRRLAALLAKDGHQVSAVSRDAGGARRALPGVDVVAASPTDGAALARHLSGVDAVVNLAGESLAQGRWTAAKKARILESRLSVTRAVVQGIRDASPRPGVLVNASAIGYYGPRTDDAPLAEDAPAGSDFLAGVCRDWERAATEAESVARVVRLRIGVVLGRGGGALPKMAMPFRMFAGGPVGSGTQWMSWIHLDDLCGLVSHAIGNHSLSGAVNATAPDARTNRDFSRELGRALGRPSWAPAPAFALRLALGEMSVLLTTGQRVVPRRAEESGYAFRFPMLPDALRDALA